MVCMGFGIRPKKLRRHTCLQPQLPVAMLQSGGVRSLPAEDHTATGDSRGHTIPTSGIGQVYVCAHDGLSLAGLFPGSISHGVV